MSFFNKCVGDYLRYAMEGIQILIEERKILDAARQKEREELIQQVEN